MGLRSLFSQLSPLPPLPRARESTRARARAPVCVLGGKVRRVASGAERARGALVGALARRLAVAARLYEEEVAPLVIVSGGSTWDGEVEADAMLAELVRLGVPRAIIVRDRMSLTTKDNAKWSAIALHTRGFDEATLVTCAWHLPRAAACFARQGIRVHGRPVEGPRTSFAARAWRWGRERVSARLDGVS